MSQTTNDFVVGICVAVVALVSFAFFFVALLGSLRAAGVIAARPRPQAVAAPAQTPPYAAPVPTAAGQSDLDRTLATLAQALAADLSLRRQGGGDTGADAMNRVPTEQHITNRRDA